MEYFTKVIIDGNEYAEMDNPAHPYITNVKLMQGTSLEAMEIGAAAVDQLVFTFYNPPRRSFDGDKVEFWISPNEDLARDDLAIIEDEVGADTEEEAIDVDDTLDLEDDDDSGDTPTPAEIDAALAAEAADTENTYDFFNGTDATPQSETTDESAEPEWRKVGEFYVYKQSATEDGTGLILECLDVVSQLVDIFVPTVATDTVQNLFDDFRAQVLSQYGITVLEHPFTTAQNIEITWKEQNTFREALSRFAGIAGGFAAVDEDSNIGISFYTFCDSIVLERDFTMYCETSAGELHLQRIDCNRSLTGRDFISSGEGQFISFTNPYVTQEMLDEMLAMYTGTRYSGAEVTMMWDGASQAGEFIRVMTSAEYANYVALNNALDDETDPDVIIDLKYNLNGLGRVLLISNQTIAFAGDAIATVQSIAETEYYKAYKQETKQKAQLRHLFKDVENLDTLIRESADGIEVGKVDDTGEYVSGHTLIDAAENAYKVIDSDGNIISSFGDEIVLGKDDVLRASTYETVVDTYADVYSGRGSSSGVVFDLPYSISGSGIADIKEVSIKPRAYSSSGAITIISNGSYVNGNSSNAYLLNRNHFVVTRAWFESYAPTWIQYIHIIKGFISTKIDEQSVDTASVRIGACNPSANYKLVTGTDSLDGSVGFSVDGSGVCDARGGFKVNGHPLIETATGNTSLSNISAGGLGTVDIQLTPPNGKTLIGVASWRVTGVTGSYVSQCQLRGVYADASNPVIHMLYKNDGTNVGNNWTFYATGIFI